MKQIIYESLIANPENGLGEMGECQDEAERIADEWMEKEKITFEEETYKVTADQQELPKGMGFDPDRQKFVPLPELKDPNWSSDDFS